MVICEVVTGTDVRRIPIIRTHFPPSTLYHLPDLEEALAHFREQDTIVLGKLIAKIGQNQNPRRQQFAGLMMVFGIIDLLLHFHKR